MRDFGTFVWQILFNGAVGAALVLDLVLYSADYLAKAKGTSTTFSITPAMYGIIFALGILVAAYRRDLRQRETIAELRGQADRVENMPVRDKSKIERAVEEAGYEVKYPHPANVLELLEQDWEYHIAVVNGKPYRIIWGDGPGGSPMMKRKRPP